MLILVLLMVVTWAAIISFHLRLSHLQSQWAIDFDKVENIAIKTGDKLTSVASNIGYILDSHMKATGHEFRDKKVRTKLETKVTFKKK